MVFWEGYVSDKTMAIFAPIVVYWLYGLFYHMLPPLNNYRLHSEKEEKAKNPMPFTSVVKRVIQQQLVSAIVSYGFFFLISDVRPSETPYQPSLLVQIFQIVIALFVLDTEQYFVHRYMHTNKFLYRHIHSEHHRLVVPYAFGAFYNHPIEGLLDTLGVGTAYLVSGMTARTGVSFFCIAIIKAVDDHCGLLLPGNLLHIFFENNTVYHHVHHQLVGSKFNFAQTYFTHWDRICGTYMPYKLVKREEGGYVAKLSGF